MVKFMCSASVAWGSWVQIPGTDLYTAYQTMLWQHSTYKIEEDWHRCELSNNLPQAKRGRLAIDVISGPTLLTKKKKRKREKKSYHIDCLVFEREVSNLFRLLESL